MILEANSITSWEQFSKQVRDTGKPMLKRLDEFRDSVLITGCQRSGTTALTRLITQCEDMVNFRFSKDDELDGALILAGIIDHHAQTDKRYCFQTTYLNERYPEYSGHQKSYKIIWVLRNPYSTIYSMLHNWKDFALNELFLDCGSQLLDERDKEKMGFLHKYGVRRTRRACYAYAGKVRQLFELWKTTGKENMRVVEYDEMVNMKKTVLPRIFSFIGLPYEDQYADMLHSKSINMKDKLSRNERSDIDRIALPVYQEALAFLRLNDSF